MWLFLSKNKIAKIFVISNQYSILLEGFLDNISVIRSSYFVIYRNSHHDFAGATTLQPLALCIHPQGNASNKPLQSKA